MEYCFITLRSLTAAQKADSSLRRAGIGCSVQKAPRWMEEQGCISGVRVPCTELRNAIRILKANRVPYRKVYFRNSSGEMEALEE